MKRNQIIILITLVLVVFSFFNFFHAADAALVTCNTNANSNACSICDLVALFKRIIDFVLFDLAPAVAVLLYLWAGFTILLGGTPIKIGEGKTIFWNTTIGLLIMFSAWMITNTILKSIAVDDISNSWYKIECREPTVGQPSSQVSTSEVPTSQPPPTVSGQAAITTGGTCTGVSCGSDTLSCDPVDPGGACSAETVNLLDADIRKGAGGINICSSIDTVKLLKAIVANESGGDVTRDSSDGLSAGPFQLTVNTANSYKSICGVPSNVNIDFSWLKQKNTVSVQACIAATFIKNSLVGPCRCDSRQLAAGYNGGGKGLGACDVSTNCGPAATGGACTMCSGQTGPTKRWECLWDDNNHDVCNANRSAGSFAPTRKYAPRVEYCYKNVF